LARFKNVLLIGAVIGALGIFAAACDDEAVTESNAQQSDITAINDRIDENEMLYTVVTTSTLGLHDMDEQLNAGTIDPSFIGNTRTLVRIYTLTDWTDDLAAEADAIRETGIELMAALEDEDIEAAAAAATELHDAEHEFSDKVWAELLGDLPEEEGGVAAHDEGGETPADGTPAADGTQEADHSEEEDEDEHSDGEPTAEATP
jgi:hypothetical protein